jgi:hypothetical protein
LKMTHPTILLLCVCVVVYVVMLSNNDMTGIHTYTQTDGWDL